MTDERLTDELARLILGWRPGADRYLISRREWIKRERFRPFTDVSSAFRLLDAVTDNYSLRSVPRKGVTVEIRRGARTEIVSDQSKSRAITLAVAHLFDLDLADTSGGGNRG